MCQNLRIQRASCLREEGPPCNPSQQGVKQRHDPLELNGNWVESQETDGEGEREREAVGRKPTSQWSCARARVKESQNLHALPAGRGVFLLKRAVAFSRSVL